MKMTKHVALKPPTDPGPLPLRERVVLIGADPEVSAMRKIIRVLKKLDVGTRARVLGIVRNGVTDYLLEQSIVGPRRHPRAHA